MPPFRPTRADLLAAKNKTVKDVIAPGLKVLFCGINPGLYTAAIGHHFGRPGNRFWPALYSGGFTDRLLDPSEKKELLKLGYGITNLVARATLRADELTSTELVAGAKVVTAKVMKFKPRFLAVVGISSYPHRLRPPHRRRRPATRHDRQDKAMGPPQPQRHQRPLPPARPRRGLRRTADCGGLALIFNQFAAIFGEFAYVSLPNSSTSLCRAATAETSQPTS